MRFSGSVRCGLGVILGGMKKAKRAYSYRFYPTPEQERVLAQNFGAARWLYNWGLEQMQKAREENRKLAVKDLFAELPLLKKQPDTAWLAECSNVVLQQSLRHLDKAFRRFFQGKACHPRFKSSKERQSISYMRNGFRYRDGKVWLAKMDAPLTIRWSRPLPKGADPSSVTISRTRGGRYYISILVDEEIAALPATSTSIGIDLNAAVVADSKGRKYATPAKLEALERRKRRYQRMCRRKIAAAKVRMGMSPNARLPKGAQLPISNNLRKAFQRVARITERMASIRRDWQHRLTTSIVRENQVIAVENLDVQGMTQSARGTTGNPGKNVRAKAEINRRILNAGFWEIRRQLEYKAEWYGRTLVVVDRQYPSSQICHSCGCRFEELRMFQKRWTCPQCGAAHDRDINAAINIHREGLAQLGRLAA